jgi:hypothetical protein
MFYRFTVLILCLLVYRFDIKCDSNTLCHENFKKSKHGNVDVRNEVRATQGLRLALALGHHGMSPLHGGVAGTCFYVRDSTRSNSHKIMA